MYTATLNETIEQGRYKDTGITCTRCHTAIMKRQDSCGTGYAIQPDGTKVCYTCCADIDREYMDAEGRITLYLTTAWNTTHGKVTNWPGSLTIPCRVKRGSHNLAGTRYDVWFRHSGQTWHGVTYGENTQLCHCKRLKTA